MDPTQVQQTQQMVNRRMANVLGHLQAPQEREERRSIPVIAPTSSSSSSPEPPMGSEVNDSQPPYSAEEKAKLKWNGWGYEGTEFDLNDEGHIYLAGERYTVCFFFIVFIYCFFFS